MKVRSLILTIFSFSYVCLTLQSALADDTEIYVSRKLPEDQQVRPNLLFVVDNSGSMKEGVPGTECPIADRNNNNRCKAIVSHTTCTGSGRWKTCKDHYTYLKTRMQVVKEVTNELVEELRLSDDVNIGLMHFDAAVRTYQSGRYSYIDYGRSYQGGMIAVPVGRVSDVAGTFTSELNKLYAQGSTPLSEAFYEASLYMKGSEPKFGNHTQAVDEGGNTADKPSVSGSKLGANYKSPIEYSCQKSNVILLTDGEPQLDNAANSDIRTLISQPNAQNTLFTTPSCRRPQASRDFDPNDTYSGECLPHLAEHLANQDVSSGQPGKQTVSTYTIGFATNQTLLQNTAIAGNGRYFTTDNTSGLVSALKSILVEILAENTTFATPSVAVSAYNNLGYRNDLYYALFRPAEGARWVGNVKRYKLKPESIDVSGNKVAAHIVDRNGQPAVDEATGFFRENASSYWSNMDGRDVAKGGIASMLADPSSRKIYTWTDADRSPTSSAGVAGSAALRTLTTGNSTITNALMGVSSTAAKEDAINWGRGIDPATGQARQQLADVLHNEPRLVAYKTDEDLLRVEAAKNGTATSPEQLYMFFGTNEGFFHAVDPNTGIEQFAFIPKELLPNLDAYHRDPKGSDAKRYGMDGQFNLWVEYGSLNTTAKTRDITKSILYAGMRRGGRNYYALDVGNITSPTLKWVIKGGATPGFEKLGQTWSTPKLADIKVNGTKTKVLIFSGGYDPLQDDDSSNTPLANDNFGNSLYIVNAETGQLIWRAGHTTETGANLQLGEMTHSMPADPVIIDINGDGLADILYAADSRAQVFRFDINNANIGATNLATGGRIAALGGGTALDNRRFFSTPDVALIRERGGKTYFTIALGSGYRAHPLNEDTIDRFYVLRDANVFTKPGTYTTMTESDLVDVSSVNLTDEEASGILEQIAEKEAAINALNQAVSDIRNRFEAYKNAEGFIAQYNAMLQANSYANDLQAQIDAIWLANPYLLAHASESGEQSKLQQGLLDIQKTMKAMLDARTDAEGDLADKQATYNTALTNRSAAQAAYDTDSTPANLQALNDAEAAYSTATIARNDASDKKQALQTHTQTLGGAYHSLIALQGGLETLYQEVQGKEQELTDARSSNSDETRLADLERELNAANEQYANNALFSTRSTLNNGTETTANLQDALAALNAAIMSGITVDIQDSLAELEALTGPGSGPETIDELLARDEDGKNTALANHSANLTDNMALLDELDGQRLEQAGLASAARAEADLIANAEYRADSELLTAEQLAAAKALYGNDLTMFEAYQYLIDQAQLATLDETDGLPALRQDINSLYAQLTPGNNYVPNKTLLASSKGWFLRLPKGEKILSASLSFRGAVLFNTFSPRGESLINCGPDVGRGRAYALSLTDAGAIFTKNDVPIRSYALVRSGIPPSPSIVFDDDGTPNIVNGPEVGGPGGNPGGGNPDPRPDGCVPGAEFCKNPAPVSKTYWREN